MSPALEKLIEDSNLRNKLYVFEDRFHAGDLLAKKLLEYKGRKDTLLFAIPAGGVQVGFIVSKRLELPLDVAVTRKIHIPWNTEAGFGAVTWDGLVILNEPLLANLRLTKEEMDRCIAEEKEAVERRIRMFRGDKLFPELKDKSVIVIDDGLASGFSMLATVMSMRKRNPKEIVVAVPTASSDAIERVMPYADKIICLNVRTGPVFAVADAYEVWYDLTEEDVVDILRMAGAI